MSSLSHVSLRYTFWAVLAVCTGGVLFAAASDEPAVDSKDITAAASTDLQKSNAHDETPRVPVAVARDRA